MKSFILPLYIILHCITFAYAQEEPLFSFGLIADVQYADVEPTGNRYYRYSLNKLERSIDFFNRYDLEFIVHLGDLIDRDIESYEKPLAIFGESKNKVLYVIGNHEYEIDEKHKPKVTKLLGINKKGYSYFDKGDWRFVMLNGMGLSIKSSLEGTKKRAQAEKKFQELKKQGAVNALVLWNHEEVKDVIFKHDHVFAYIGGHEHCGSYVCEKGKHFLAVKGVLNESEVETSCAVVHVFDNRMEFKGFGREEDRIWEIR